MRKVRVLNDLGIKTYTRPDGSRVTKDGKRVLSICGTGTQKYYDKSNPRYRIPAIDMNLYVSFAGLAIRFYNIKEHTNFGGQVKVRKVMRTIIGMKYDNRITFKAFSPLGEASRFEAEVREHFLPYHQFEIRYVRIKSSRSNHSGNISRQELPPDFPQQLTLSDDSLKDLAPYLSQYALVMYNTDTLRAKKVAVHDIPSLKVVRAVKQDAEGTTYLVTFEASSRVSKNVETFETQICFTSLSPTIIIQIKEIQNKDA